MTICCYVKKRYKVKVAANETDNKAILKDLTLA